MTEVITIEEVRYSEREEEAGGRVSWTFAQHLTDPRGYGRGFG